MRPIETLILICIILKQEAGKRSAVCEGHHANFHKFMVWPGVSLLVHKTARRRRTHSIPQTPSLSAAAADPTAKTPLSDDMVTTAGRREMCRINFTNIIPHTIQALLIECWLRVLSILEMLYVPSLTLRSLARYTPHHANSCAAGFRLKWRRINILRRITATVEAQSANLHFATCSSEADFLGSLLFRTLCEFQMSCWLLRLCQLVPVLKFRPLIYWNIFANYCRKISETKLFSFTIEILQTLFESRKE
jgi:hypothetical protein